MEGLKLEAPTTALILIDLQYGVVAEAKTEPYAAAAVIENAAAMAAAFRAKGAMVVYVRVDMKNFLQLPADEPSRIPENLPAMASELVPESGVQTGDLVIVKRHWSAFSGTELEERLREAGVTTVVIGGVSTTIGVDSTARSAAGLGFAVVVVEDACADREAAVHHASFAKIFPRLGRVRKTAEVIAALE